MKIKLKANELKYFSDAFDIHLRINIQYESGEEIPYSITMSTDEVGLTRFNNKLKKIKYQLSIPTTPNGDLDVFTMYFFFNYEKAGKGECIFTNVHYAGVSKLTPSVYIGEDAEIDNKGYWYENLWNYLPAEKWRTPHCLFLHLLKNTFIFHMNNLLSKEYPIKKIRFKKVIITPKKT